MITHAMAYCTLLYSCPVIARNFISHNVYKLQLARVVLASCYHFFSFFLHTYIIPYTNNIREKSLGGKYFFQGFQILIIIMEIIVKTKNRNVSDECDSRGGFFLYNSFHRNLQK